MENNLTELPDKWYIARTKENSKIVNEWSNIKHRDTLSSICDVDYIFSNKTAEGNLRTSTNYTEITFEQFKKWVLKEINDKPKFEVGKWYRADYNDSNNPHYIKCDRIVDNNFHYNGWFTLNPKNEGFYTKGDSHIKSLGYVIEADITSKEIQEFLPNGHIDKLANSSKDKVVHCKTQEELNFASKILNSCSTRTAPYCVYTNNGGFDTVEICKSDSYIYIYSFQEWCDTYGHKPDFVKKDDKGRILKTFEIGEWYLNPLLNWRDSSSKIIGKYFRIKEVKIQNSKNYYYNSIIFDQIADGNWNIGYCNISQNNTNFDAQMVKVEQPKTKEKEEKNWTPKLGDYVVIKDKGSSLYPNTAKIGDIVQIIKIKAEGGHATTEDPRYFGKDFNLRLKDLRKAEPHEIPKNDECGILDILSYEIF